MSARSRPGAIPEPVTPCHLANLQQSIREEVRSIGPPCRRRGLIQYQPVETKLSDSIHELAEIDGLAHVAVGAQAVTMDPVMFLFGRVQNDDREETRKLICSQLS